MTSKAVFLVCILFCQVASAQTKLLSEPKSQSGVSAVKDAKEFFKSQKQFIGFDDAAPNTRINDKYKKLGVTFSSSNEDDSVIVMLYSFAEGKSQKHSIASANPQYQGKVTISFAKNVESVGFNLSHVSTGGTLVDAFDQDEKFLGRFGISKTRPGTVFFGIKSKSPIAKLVISPVVKIDLDFALDDLAFTFAAK